VITLWIPVYHGCLTGFPKNFIYPTPDAAPCPIGGAKLEWSILKTVKEFNPEFAIEINRRMVIFIKRKLDVLRRFFWKQQKNITVWIEGRSLF
jgi:hypothetical protein